MPYLSRDPVSAGIGFCSSSRCYIRVVFFVLGAAGSASCWNASIFGSALSFCVPVFRIDHDVV